MTAQEARDWLNDERMQGLETPNDDYFLWESWPQAMADQDSWGPGIWQAYIKGPPGSGSLYDYRLVKVQIQIHPDSPPNCIWMHGSDRTYPSPYSDLNPDYPAPYVHPHLWANGKIEGLRCLQEEGEGGWEDGMGIKTVLTEIRSLLDFDHENGDGHSEDYNDYVQFLGWEVLLFNYLAEETHPGARAFLREHICKYGEEIKEELKRQKAKLGTQTLLLIPPELRDPLYSPRPPCPGKKGPYYIRIVIDYNKYSDQLAWEMVYSRANEQDRMEMEREIIAIRRSPWGPRTGVQDPPQKRVAEVKRLQVGRYRSDYDYGGFFQGNLPRMGSMWENPASYILANYLRLVDDMK